MAQTNCSNCNFPTTPLEIIPLASAVLCVDCNMITAALNSHCLACGSHAILGLATVLDRDADVALYWAGERAPEGLRGKA